MIDLTICDDDQTFSALLMQSVETLRPDTFQIRQFPHAEALREAIEEGYHPQIAILDILLGTESGIALAQQLFPASCETSVIFVTGYAEYCTDVYEAEHLYFLLKPIQKEKLQLALRKAEASLQKARASVLTVRADGGLRRVNTDEIRFVESSYRKLYLHLQEEVIPFYGSLAEDKCRFSENFFQCHKSFLVNGSYIESMKADRFILFDGEIVPISQKRYAESRTFFLDFLRKHLGGV